MKTARAGRHVSEELLVAFALGRASPDERRGVERHVDECPLCLELLAAASKEGAGAGLSPSAPVTAAREVVDSGQTVGRYELLDKVGEGGMSVVYAAWDGVLDRKVALKIVKPGTFGPRPEQAMEQQVREAKALARLAHPNVTPAYDFGVHEGQVFMAMELVEGVNLRRWLKMTSPRPEEILEVFFQAGRGLSAAHAAGLVHRDFKPDNVLVGNDGRVRVTDFGLARLLDEPTQPAARSLTSRESPGGDQTTVGRLMGTPTYMSKEQFEGEAVDARTDQFSFCVALYQALFGTHPFGDTPDQIRAALIRGQVRAPVRTTAFTRRLRPALLRGLSSQRTQRFPTLDALLEALERARRPSRRFPVVAGAALAASVALLVAFHLSDERASVGSKGRAAPPALVAAPRDGPRAHSADQVHDA